LLGFSESRELVQVVVREVGCEREDVSGVAAGSGVVVAAVAAGRVAGRASRLCRKTISRWALAHGFPQKPDMSAFRLIVFRQSLVDFLRDAVRELDISAITSDYERELRDDPPGCWRQH